MRLGKILAIGALATLATSVFAQFGVYGSDGNLNSGFVANPGSGSMMYDFRIRMDIPEDAPGSPLNGGGTFVLTFNPRYIDIELKHTVTGATTTVATQVSGASVGQIVNLGLYGFRGLSDGSPLVGAAAIGARKNADGTIEFKAAFLATSPSDSNPGAADPFLRTGTVAQGRPVPKLMVNWANIEQDFGVNNPYTPSGAGSFVFIYRDDFSNYQTREVGVNGMSFTVVPEPASMIALGSGLVGLLALRRRRAN